MRGRKSTLSAKLNAASQQERLHKWKEYFKNLVENSLETTDKPIQKSLMANWTSN